MNNFFLEFRSIIQSYPNPKPLGEESVFIAVIKTFMF